MRLQCATLTCAINKTDLYQDNSFDRYDIHHINPFSKNIFLINETKIWITRPNEMIVIVFYN